MPNPEIPPSKRRVDLSEFEGCFIRQNLFRTSSSELLTALPSKTSEKGAGKPLADDTKCDPEGKS